MTFRKASAVNPLIQLLSYLQSREDLKDRIKHIQQIPAISAKYQAWPKTLSADLIRVLEKSGFDALYLHQAKAFTALQEGTHVAVTTPTASGKTLCFNLPVMQSVLENSQARALYLYPMKALAQDQLKTLQEWGGRLKTAKLPTFSAEIYDGDTPTGVRTKIRKNPPNILLTNPDMLHLGILAFHDGWAEFFKNLKYVVVDEAHSYRGIFGSHVAHVLRRLRRICKYYGSNPQFIMCSATLGNPEEFLDGLTGLEFEIVSETGAPQNAKTFVLWNPDTTSPYTEATTLLIECLKADMKTIVFTKARKITELISMWVTQARPEWAAEIKSYRAGYLPEERREIESKLFKDELRAVISTSALEVGIDVGGLDACILVGYPGTMISTWQRSGRVGRGEAPSVVFLVAMVDAMDQYWMKHPKKFFTMKPESLMVGFENENIAVAHLRCAASEVPLTTGDEAIYGNLFKTLMPDMIKEGQVLESSQGDKWLVTDKNPQRNINIRDMGQGYQIVYQQTGELIGTIDGMRAFRDCHPGAVYLHQGTQYVVKELQWETHKIIVNDEPVDYYTQVNYEEETEILEELNRRPLGYGPAQCVIKWGKVKITQKFINYEIHRIVDQSLVSTVPLTLPPQTFETRALWMILPDYLQRNLIPENIHFMGGLHAAEHGTIAMMPLHVVCDRWDLGGISTPAHPQVPQPVIFIYDGYPGGVGLTERAYQTMEQLLATTFEMIRDCECEDGCPSCIQSPKCGNGNHPLDKKGALLILGHILGRSDMKPVKGGVTFDPISIQNTIAPPPKPAQSTQGIQVQSRPMTETPKSGPQIKTEPPPSKTGPVVFDIETQYLAAEIPGGWANLPGMKLSCAVVYDVDQAKYYTYIESNVKDLIAHLQASSLVIGFNTIRFDYGVLQGYTKDVLAKMPSLDLMADLQKKLGHRLSLAHLAEHTLGGAEKSADGLLAVKWWREGLYQQVIDYCQMDVKLTLDLWKFGQDNKHVLFAHKQSGEILKCPVSW
ncbi:MAG TPA: DEAD/DEAH box helicase [bacterium]|jgi:DEAD/DEAH box helicase domain-containing protein|nr:DEAD/DEAH box helicase [bacterium]